MLLFPVGKGTAAQKKFAVLLTRSHVATACLGSQQFHHCSVQGPLTQRLPVQKAVKPNPSVKQYLQKTTSLRSVSCKSEPTGYWNRFRLPSPYLPSCGEHSAFLSHFLSLACQKKRSVQGASLRVAMVTARCCIATR